MSVIDPHILEHFGLDEREMFHFGVKGMKWGVRKRRGDTPRGTDSPDAISVRETKAKIKSGGTNALTNKELQQLVTRMNLEQQYGKLVAGQPSKFKTGHKVIKDVIGVGKTVNEVVSFVNSPTGQLIKKELSKSKK